MIKEQLFDDDETWEIKRSCGGKRLQLHTEREREIEKDKTEGKSVSIQFLSFLIMTHSIDLHSPPFLWLLKKRRPSDVIVQKKTGKINDPDWPKRLRKRRRPSVRPILPRW